MRITRAESEYDFRKTDVSFLAYTNARRQWQGEQCILYDASGDENMRLMGGTDPYFPTLGWLTGLRRHSWRIVLQSSCKSGITHHLVASGSNAADVKVEIRDAQGRSVATMSALGNGYEIHHNGVHIAKTTFSPRTGTVCVNGLSWQSPPRQSIPFEQKGIWLVLGNTEDREVTLERLLALALTPLMGRIQGHNEMVPAMQ